MSSQVLSTTNILKVFEYSLQEHSGRITDTIHDGARLFLRSLLLFTGEVQSGDRMQGGLALKADENEISLHPYLFRKVCSNGAIMARSTVSWHAEYSQYDSEKDVIMALQGVIATCCERDVFTSSIRDLRTSIRAQAVSALDRVLMILEKSRTVPQPIMDQVFKRFSTSPDRSRFSLMNAITSVARDTRDPEQRWRLEELGGSIGAGILPEQPLMDGGAHLTLHSGKNHINVRLINKRPLHSLDQGML